MNGDVRVFGLVAGTHVLEDIGMDVPHGREVTIPAEKAARSKDLYRAVNQKRIFLLPAPPVSQHVAPVTHIRDDVLQERNQFLEARNKQLEEENAQLREALRKAMSQEERLDFIYKALQQGLPVLTTSAASAEVRTFPAMEIADGTVPQFIPAEIAPKDVQAHIAATRAEGDASGLSEAAARLKKMRQGAADR
jgi:hypothetical protein